jgi:pseudaminic acid cytidylyltransferase
MKVAIIPARGGSKRIPRKNIKTFCGKPMIAWSIEAAKNSNLFDMIIVSTDDVEIADVSKQYGADVPFVRPTLLSDDYAGTTEVVAHAVHWMMGQGCKISSVCCIYATAPFVQIDDIKLGHDMLNRGDWEYAFSVTDFSAPIFRAFKQTSKLGVEMFFPEYFDTRSQDLPVALQDAGQFYWGKPSAWLENKRIFDHHSIPIVIPRWRVQDIDTQSDWLRAELMHAEMTSRGYIT